MAQARQRFARLSGGLRCELVPKAIADDGVVLDLES